MKRTEIGSTEHCRPAIASALLIIALALAACRASSSPSPGQTRRPAAVMDAEGASWLERPEREQEERPDIVLKAMNLKPGHVVAEIGVGTGFFARRIAKQILPGGKVYGVDIQSQMLTLLEQRSRADGLTNVIPVLGDEVDPKLSPASVDWIVLVDVYHEFQRPEQMLRKMAASLKPGGRVALVEYRLEGTSADHIKVDHRMSIPQVRSEWEHSGFRLVKLVEDLPTQHLFIFEVAPKI